jgi:hypothetical protein
MPTPPSDRQFVRLYLDVDRWMSNRDRMACMACASTTDVKQGARRSGARLPVWACSSCQQRLDRLKRKDSRS